MKYLITDDSLMGRKILSNNLKNSKFFKEEEDDIFFANNGLEGLNSYKENKPDICFMDLTMPVMDGYEAVEHILKFDNKAKIVVVTADAQQMSKNKVQNLGALAFIIKPVEPIRLCAVLEHIIKNQSDFK
jgi:two-component system, chemotaxis family, chemotaxis protein CheY